MCVYGGKNYAGFKIFHVILIYNKFCILLPMPHHWRFHCFLCSSWILKNKLLWWESLLWIFPFLNFKFLLIVKPTCAKQCLTTNKFLFSLHSPFNKACSLTWNSVLRAWHVIEEENGTLYWRDFYLNSLSIIKNEGFDFKRIQLRGQECGLLFSTSKQIILTQSYSDHFWLNSFFMVQQYYSLRSWI